MALAKSAKGAILLVIIMIAFCGISMAAVYDVGDDAGWTSMGHVDYEDWVADKNFYVGDTLVFNYNNQFHNVKQVKHQDFESCNAISPFATYTNGSDSINLNKPGHYYFICGYPGHCVEGQKVDIMVTLASPSPISSPNLSVAPYNQPNPTQSSAPSIYSSKLSKLWLVVVGIASIMC